MGFTTEQQLAIDLQDKNILVSAAAGSGKTAVLTERVIKRVLNTGKNRVNIDRFLIVTFTNAAASEMKERIEIKLGDALSTAADGEEVDYLQKQLGLLGKASISTIHSFCGKLIRTHFNELGLEPNMRTCTEQEATLLQNLAVTDILTAAFEEESDAFYQLCDAYGSVNGMDAIASMILQIYKFTQSTVFPQKWLAQQVATLEAGDNAAFEASLAADLRLELESIQTLLERALVIAKKPNGPLHYADSIGFNLQNLSKMDLSSFANIVSALANCNIAALSRKRPACDLSLKDAAKSLSSTATSRLKYLQDNYAILADPTVISKTASISTIFKELARLVTTFETRYAEKKQDLGVLDFNDLEHYAIKLLVTESDGALAPTTVAKELGKYYSEIYIDEYQDVNDVQETILSAIATNGATRFMVGDIKQSIYKFRLSNPKIFLDKYNRFQQFSPTAAADIRIDLSHNFRSRAIILDAANEIFERLMRPAVGDLIYDQAQRLYAGREYATFDETAKQCELHLLELSTLDADDAEEPSNKAELEAAMIAKIVKDILDGNSNPKIVYDKDLDIYRAVEPRDIAILVRAKAVSTAFENALYKVGVDAYAEISKSFFEATEVELMINFLKIIDNINQDIPFLSVLHSSLLGLDFDELSEIRTYADGSFYNACVAYKQLHPHSKLADFFTEIEGFRKLSKMVPVSELIDQVFLQTGYLGYVSMLDHGAIRSANLRILKQTAIDFEQNTKVGLFNFLIFLEQLRNDEASIQQAKSAVDQNNTVKIMSIHKSKGLEFPIVILANAHKRFNQMETYQPILLHNQLGLGAQFRDMEKYVDYTTLPYLAIKNKIFNENISEEIRILYVALTRAKEKLIVTAVTNSFDSLLSNALLHATEHIDSIFIRNQNSYLNWIILALAHHPYTLTESVANFNAGTMGQWIIKQYSRLSFADADADFVEPPSSNEVIQDIFDLIATDTSSNSLKDEIFAKLDYEYRHILDTTLPQKISVSELKTKMSDSISSAPYSSNIPKFIASSSYDGLSHGNIIHAVFQHLDYLKYTDHTSIRQNIESMIAQNKLAKNTLAIANIDRLVSFANSAIINRMRKAAFSFKEQPFLYQLPQSEGRSLIAGIVDAYFEENGKIIIIDYKTDSTKAHTKIEIVDRYRLQIQWYSEALQNITHKVVTERYLYLYSIDEFVAL